jgi:MFS family permease
MSGSAADRPASVAASRTPESLRLRLDAMMFLQYFIQGSYAPVLTLYVQDALGFGPDQMGLLQAAVAFGPLAAPFVVGQLVDRHLATQHVLAGCHLLGAALMLALWFQTGFWPVAVLGVLYSLTYVPTMMLTNSLAFHHLSDRDREFPAIRLWGTIGFVTPAWLVEGVFLSGLRGDELNRTRGIVLLVSAAGSLAMAVYSATCLPATPPPSRGREDLAPARVLRLLCGPAFVGLVLSSLAIGAAHQFFFVWNGPFLGDVLRTGGATGAWEQRIASLGQIFEVLVMVVLGAAVKRLGFRTVLSVGATAYAVRCVLLAGAAAANGPWLPEGSTAPPTFAALLGSATFLKVMSLVACGEMLHGVCFGCFLAVAFMYVDRLAPKDVRGSMQNIYGNVVVAVGALAGGAIGGRVGAWFTSAVGAAPLRREWGLTGDAGLVEFVQGTGEKAVVAVRDWPGIWSSGALLAILGLVLLALLFPRTAPTEVTEEG